MKFKLLAGAALAAVFSATGAAAEVGWYGAVDLGYHWPEALKATSSNLAANGIPYTWDFNQKDDWAGFARLGYQVSDHWRVELEVGYRGGDIKSVHGGTNQAVVGLCTPGVVRTTAAPTCGAPNGQMNSWSGLANVIYDVLPHSSLDPFIGVGVGVDHLTTKVDGQFSNVTGVVTPVGGTNPPFQNLHIDDNDTVFAWQALAGLAWKATDRLNVDLTYRYLSGADHSITSTGSSPLGLQPGTFKGKYKDDSVTLGLRYSFAAPPPPPAFEAKQFVVYFPFDQYILTPEAQQVVQEAANYANQGHATKVVVVGHTDTSGSDAYNLRLSERRAKAVADALVGLGVQQSTLAVDWKGEQDLAVQTGDGVKEPLNRRSTIDINF
jgi:OOP family OmpA-OmpF porin